MKKVILAIAAFVALAFSTTSCSLLSGSSANALSSGTSTGLALLNLYSQYKTDGNKLDLSNTSNLVNIASLASAAQVLKGQSETADTSSNTLLSQFASGLTSGSQNLITSTVAPTVTNTLTNLANTTDLSSLVSAATKASSTASTISSTASEVSSTVSSIKNIFSLLK